MARIFNNILGSLSGSVGPLVFYRMHGCDFVRRKPIQAKHRMTPAQERQRIKFKIISGFITSMKDLVSWSFKERAHFMTGHNYAMSKNMIPDLNKGLGGDYPDYQRMCVSAGSLTNVSGVNIKSIKKEQIDFSWKHVSEFGKAQMNDKCILVAYAPQTNKSFFTVGEAIREDGKAKLQLPGVRDEIIHTWISFISENGKTVANSLYAGSWFMG